MHITSRSAILGKRLIMTTRQPSRNQYAIDQSMQQVQQFLSGCVARTKDIVPKLRRPSEQGQSTVDNEHSTQVSETHATKTSQLDMASDPAETAKKAFSNSVKRSSDEAYKFQRQNLLTAEKASSWDSRARQSASAIERKAQQIILKIREDERRDPKLFGDLPSEAVPHNDTRDAGGRFLVNKDRIDRSKLFDIALNMPKGAHLHIHFNSEIKPEVLFPFARKLTETMYVRATQSLHDRSALADGEIVFNVLPKETPNADIFDASYKPDFKNTTNNPWMRWSDFRAKFPTGVRTQESPAGLDDAERWAREKMVLTAQAVYNDRQTHNGVWACFNQGTRAFKGLVNYESVYRWYIGALIDNMIKDKVMYAELRPMLLDKFIPSDDGMRQLDHKDQMQIIVEEVSKKRNELKARGEIDRFPFGIKIIYSTPRSISREMMAKELEDCIRLKLQFPDLVCGFDLVGAEDRPNHVDFYADLLLAFTNTCRELGISIPFMFHAGESLLDTGGSSNPDNSNLYDALLLNSKRIGHGYALLKHPLLIEKYKAANISLELCPISNELLHLCGNIRQHPYPALLAAGLHCSLNGDNPSLFRGTNSDTSTLSHEFYQVMVGDTRMTIHGWKQLAEWSLEHSCFTSEELQRALSIFRKDWEVFCEWVVRKYDGLAQDLPNVS